MSDTIQETKAQPEKKQRKSWVMRLMQFVINRDNESEDPDDLTPREYLNGITTQWVLQQLGFIGVIFAFAMITITNGYLTQSLQVKRNALKREVEDYTFRALTRSSQLTRETRQSIIEDRLRSYGDSTLTPTPDAPFIIERDTKE